MHVRHPSNPSCRLIEQSQTAIGDNSRGQTHILTDIRPHHLLAPASVNTNHVLSGRGPAGLASRCHVADILFQSAVELPVVEREGDIIGIGGCHGGGVGELQRCSARLRFTVAVPWVRRCGKRELDVAEANAVEDGGAGGYVNVNPLLSHYDEVDRSWSFLSWKLVKQCGFGARSR
jgi:hypothetical protein